MLILKMFPWLGWPLLIVVILVGSIFCVSVPLYMGCALVQGLAEHFRENKVFISQKEKRDLAIGCSLLAGIVVALCFGVSWLKSQEWWAAEFGWILPSACSGIFLVAAAIKRREADGDLNVNMVAWAGAFFLVAGWIAFTFWDSPHTSHLTHEKVISAHAAPRVESQPLLTGIPPTPPEKDYWSRAEGSYAGEYVETYHGNAEPSRRFSMTVLKDGGCTFHLEGAPSREVNGRLDFPDEFNGNLTKVGSQDSFRVTGWWSQRNLSGAGGMIASLVYFDTKKDWQTKLELTLPVDLAPTK